MKRVVNDPKHEQSQGGRAPDRPSTQAGKALSRWLGRRFLLVGGTALLLMLCVVLCAATLTSSFVTAVTQKGHIEAVLDQFMTAMVNKDAERACTLFSNRAKRQMSCAEIASWLEGNDYVLFEGYESLHVKTLSVGPAHSTDPEQPQGTVARVSGGVNYAGGYEGGFQAILEKEDGEWKLDNIRVNAPSGKPNTTSGGE